MARVLIVEDDPGAARLADLVLSIEGYDTEVAGTGAQLRARLDGAPADLVLLDVMLPDANGLDLLVEVRDAPRWIDARVVLLTALEGPEDSWRCWSSGADYYLTKPVDLPLMRSVVRRLLAGEDLVLDQPRTSVG
jgi:DNA-binding response OmpR family regulator